MLTPRRRNQWRVNRYLWLCLGYSAIWLLIRASQLGTHSRTLLLIVFLAAVLNVATRTLVAFRNERGTTGSLGWIFTSVDISMIACAVRLTGKAASDLWLLYFFVMVTETLSVSIRAEMVLTGLVFVGLTAAEWPVSDWMGYATRLFFLFITGAVARRIHANIQAHDDQMSHLRERLAVEQEKSRLAREIHDGVGREIVNAILGLEIASRLAQSGSNYEEVRVCVRENIDLLRSAMDSTRLLVFETRPWTVDEEGGGPLTDRLTEYAHRFADRAQVVVDIRLDDAVNGLSQTAAFTLLRVMQEALNNIAKHAQARRVVIRVKCPLGHFGLMVRDDGCGFDTSALAASSGMGLSGMRERARQIGGRVDIVSRPGAGSTVMLAAPLGQ